mmetsp:Transcript_6925/g.6441  ORF Transcript_6925/g.6441 Transcript_6925/m.6441 type:complete len:84 (-) Transcript_6925:8-259(-)
MTNRFVVEMDQERRQFEAKFEPQTGKGFFRNFHPNDINWEYEAVGSDIREMAHKFIERISTEAKSTGSEEYDSTKQIDIFRYI